eukprot:9052578-Karenia_brevis.AAC.1
MNTKHRREVFLSAGGPQTGKTWSELPPSFNKFMDNDHFKMAMNLRLGAVTVPDGATCMIPKSRDQDCCLAAIGNPVVHPFLCKQGPARLRPHRSLCNALTKLQRRSGAHVDMERAVPQLYMLEADGDRITEAILDVVSSYPGGLCKAMVDVTIRAPHAGRYGDAHRKPGVAALS